MSKLPFNPPIDGVLHIDKSDGRAWHRPTKLQYDSGSFEFYDLVSPGDLRYRAWRARVGFYLDYLLRKRLPDMKYVSRIHTIDDFPSNYTLYFKPRESGVHIDYEDLYLYGGGNGRVFRSPREFVFHAYWLLTSTPQNPTSCECKYCSTTSQTKLNERLGIFPKPTKTTPVSSLPIMRPRNNDDDEIVWLDGPPSENRGLTSFYDSDDGDEEILWLDRARSQTTQSMSQYDNDDDEIVWLDGPDYSSRSASASQRTTEDHDMDDPGAASGQRPAVTVLGRPSTTTQTVQQRPVPGPSNTHSNQGASSQLSSSRRFVVRLKVPSSFGSRSPSKEREQLLADFFGPESPLSDSPEF